MFFRHSFKNKLTFSFLTVSLVLLFLNGFLLLQILSLTVNKRSRHETEDELDKIIKTLSWLDLSFKNAKSKLEDNAELTAFLEQDKYDEQKNIYNLLYDASSSLRNYGLFDLYDTKGNCLFSTAVGNKSTKETGIGILFRAAKNTSGVIYNAENGMEEGSGLLLEIASALTDGRADDSNRIRGYLVMRMYTENFRSLFYGKYAPQNELLLLNRFWHPVYGSNLEITEKTAPFLRTELMNGRLPKDKIDDYNYTVHKFDASNMFIVLQQPEFFNKATIDLFVSALLLCTIICIFVSVFISLRLSSQMSRPIRQLQQGFNELEQNNMNVRIESRRKDEFGKLAERFNHMVSVLHQNNLTLLKNQRELNLSQIRMLQSQLNPHFLCNTLDTIKWTGKINKIPELSTMAADLADILRFAITDEEFVPLWQEVDLLEKYIQIQKIRFPDKITFTTEVPRELEDCLIPKMILQPIIENSVLHGLEGVENSIILVKAELEDSKNIKITCSDNGPGFPPTMPDAQSLKTIKKNGHHLGLYNVNTILQKHFGQEYGLAFFNKKDNGGAVVTVRFPKLTGVKR